MKLDNKALALNTTAKVIHGVELSKDQTGVTAAISASGYTASVHFNGYTAQIRITGMNRTKRYFIYYKCIIQMYQSSIFSADFKH